MSPHSAEEVEWIEEAQWSNHRHGQACSNNNSCAGGEEQGQHEDHEMYTIMRTSSVSTKNDTIPSNERLLGTAFFSFMSFALTQLIFAFIADSEAMMGDSAAMIVDAITYLFNWVAERRKNQFDASSRAVAHYAAAHCAAVQYDMDQCAAGAEEEAGNANDSNPAEITRLRKRAKRKMVLQLEIVPPILSVTTLIIVTAFVTRKAVRVLILDMHRSVDFQRIPNIKLMLAFSILNLALDGLNVFCFARAKHLLGYATEDNPVDLHAGHHGQDDTENASKSNETYTGSPKIRDKRTDYAKVDISDENCEESSSSADDEQPIIDLEEPKSNINGNLHDCSFHPTVADQSFESHDTNNQDHANLNMCAAYTHVFADTLRSIAVIVAAITAEVIPNVTPEEADATAAVVVSALILLSLMPLVQGLLRGVAELRMILAEERSEAMFLRARPCSLEMT